MKPNQTKPEKPRTQNIWPHVLIAMLLHEVVKTAIRRTILCIARQNPRLKIKTFLIKYKGTTHVKVQQKTTHNISSYPRVSGNHKNVE